MWNKKVNNFRQIKTFTKCGYGDFSTLYYLLKKNLKRRNFDALILSTQYFLILALVLYSSIQKCKMLKSVNKFVRNQQVLSFHKFVRNQQVLSLNKFVRNQQVLSFHKFVRNQQVLSFHKVLFYPNAFDKYCRLQRANDRC